MKHRTPRSKLLATFDRDFVFRPDMPDVKYVIDYRRKVIYSNMDAYPWADLVMRIGRVRRDV